MIASRSVVTTALGVSQILAFGASYYLLSVLAGPIARDTGWPVEGVVGAAAVGTIVSGLAAPKVGRIIDARGGRPALTVAALAFCLGHLTMGLAPAFPVFVLGWAILGIGMSAGLYGAVFSTLARLYGLSARSSIAAVTLWGGFASTLCWPLTAFLEANVGWRGACLAYAAADLALLLPIALLIVPEQRPAAAPAPSPAAARTIVAGPRLRRAALLLAALSVACGAASNALSMHLLTLLQARGLTLVAAIALGAWIGPAQVAGRLIETGFGQRFHPLWTMAVATGLFALGLALLAAGADAILALVLYSLGNGAFSIARGAVPLALFGPERYATLMGRIDRPALLASALSPFLAAFALTRAGPEALLWTLALAAAVAPPCVAALAVIARPAAPARLQRPGEAGDEGA